MGLDIKFMCEGRKAEGFHNKWEPIPIDKNMPAVNLDVYDGFSNCEIVGFIGSSRCWDFLEEIREKDYRKVADDMNPVWDNYHFDIRGAYISGPDMQKYITDNPDVFDDEEMSQINKIMNDDSYESIRFLICEY